ncbi:MAG: hypothetical protein KF902_00760 [Phycisphaeraceae bacterium]|nr:hypothetical protein [Phycisphaeraceae bacterium]
MNGRSIGLMLATCGAAALCALSAGCHSGPARERSACGVNVVPLVYTEMEDHAWREPESEWGAEWGGVAVAAAYKGTVGYLAMDTGSALTFLYLGRDGERYVKHAGTVRIGCESFDLPGRNFQEDDDRGIGIIGVLGADYLLDVPSVFDPSSGLITRYPDDAGKPVGERAIDAIETVAEIPFEDVGGHILVTVRVDGRDLRLMWDTGCPHLLWLGEGGRAGDEEHTGQDVEGGQFPMYFGAAMLELPPGRGGATSEPAREIPALRVPRFPYYEGTVEALGGNIHGLAGQSVFGRHVMVFDAVRGVIGLGAAWRAAG